MFGDDTILIIGVAAVRYYGILEAAATENNDADIMPNADAIMRHYIWRMPGPLAFLFFGLLIFARVGCV